MIELLALLTALDCTATPVTGTYDAGGWDLTDGTTGTFAGGDVRGEPAVGYRWGGYRQGKVGASMGGGYLLGTFGGGQLEGYTGVCPDRDPTIFHSWYGGPWRVSTATIALAGQSNADGRGSPHPRHEVAGIVVDRGVLEPSYAGKVSIETIADDPNIRVVKRGHGGKPIADWLAVDGYADRLIAEAAAHGLTPALTVWLHGGADAGVADRPFYVGRTHELFDRLEGEWGPQQFFDAYLSPRNADRIALNALKDQIVVERDDTSLLYVDDLTYLPDGIHFDRASLDELSLRVRDELDHTRAVWTP